MIRIIIAALLLSTSAIAARVETVRNGSGGGGGGGETNQSCELTGGPNCVMLDQIRAADGTAAIPSYSFNSDQNTGIDWISADSFGFATGGTNRLTLSASLMTSLLPIVVSGAAVDIASLATEDLILQAGTTGATGVSTTLQRMWTVARNSAGTSAVFALSPDTAVADAEIGRSIGSGGSGTAHFSCGTNSPCAQIRALSTGYSSLHIASPASSGDNQASLWFELGSATNDKEMWAFEQKTDRLAISNFDEDSWVSGGNFVSMAFLDSGPVLLFSQTAAATVAAPATCAANIAGSIAHFDDSDDDAPSAMCFCSRTNNAGVYAWRKVADETVSCFGL